MAMSCCGGKIASVARAEGLCWAEGKVLCNIVVRQTFKQDRCPTPVGTERKEFLCDIKTSVKDEDVEMYVVVSREKSN